MYLSQLSRCHGSNNIEWKNRDAFSLGEYQERDHILDFMDSRKLIQCFEFSIKIKIYKKLEYKTRCFQPQRVSAARQCCRILLDLISQMFPNVSNQTDSRNFDYDVCDMMFWIKCSKSITSKRYETKWNKQHASSLGQYQQHENRVMKGMISFIWALSWSTLSFILVMPFMTMVFFKSLL